jgi:hypothetical protein
VTGTVAPAGIVPERLDELLPFEADTVRLVFPIVTECDPVPVTEIEQVTFSVAPEVFV